MKDQRYSIAQREAWIGLILAVFHFLWWYGFAYSFGRGRVEDYTYILGLPAWFFYSCVLGFLIMVMIVSITVKYFFKEVPFDDESGAK